MATAFSILESIKHLDLYVLLGVEPEATHEEIKLAYEKRAVKWRPDNNPEDSQLLLNAFTVLSDKAARRDYDAVLTARKAANNNSNNNVDDGEKESKCKREREEGAPEEMASKKCKRGETEEEEYARFLRTCQVCNLLFNDNGSRNQHIYCRHVLICEYGCGGVFKNDAALNQHRRTRHGCQWSGCDRVFPTYGDRYQQHVREVHTFWCEYGCKDQYGHDRVFRSAEALNQHRRDCHLCRWSGCSGSFPTYHDLAKHRKDCHGLCCEYGCQGIDGYDRVFKTCGALDQHRQACHYYDYGYNYWLEISDYICDNGM